MLMISLDWAVKAVSFFNTILLFWLGLMVVLTGNRRSAGTWLVGGGLFLGTVFFVSHSMIMGSDISRFSLGLDVWWTVSWIPALAAPIFWYGSMLWYAGFRFKMPHPHRKYLALILILLLLMVVQVVVWNPVPSYQTLLSRVIPDLSTKLGGLPFIVFTYLILSILCYLLPLDLMARDLFSDKPLAAAAFRKARPWLMMASISLLLAGLVMVWTALWILESSPLPSLTNPQDVITVKYLDLLAASFVGVAIVLLGRAIVAYEVFTGRPLPRNRFSRQWRSTVILAAGYSSLIAYGLTIHLPMLTVVMMGTLLFTLFYGLYSWRSYSERSVLIAQVRPFLTSGDLFSQVIDPDGKKFFGPEKFLESLCQNVLSVPAAAIIPAPGVAPLVNDPLVFNPFNKPFDNSLPVDMEEKFRQHDRTILPGEGVGVAWMVSLWWDDDLIGVFLLGEKADGNPFTAEEIEVAQLGGERLLDMLAGAEMARVAIALLQERLSELSVLEGKGRRILHDEVLPEIHTAILKVSAAQQGENSEAIIGSLSRSHHLISDLIRDTPPTVPVRLTKMGLVAALHELMVTDFDRAFKDVFWDVSDEAETTINDLPEIVQEVLYFAIRELIRNAHRYAHGTGRPGNITLKLRFKVEESLVLHIEDNGVGFGNSSVEANGSGHGLRFHTAMLAVVGARLTIRSASHGGTHAIIRIPLNG